MIKIGRFIDLTGQIFGRLKVLYYLEERNSNKKIIWVCECDCGVSIEVVGGSLRKGETKSCGCLKIEKAKKHGLTKTKLYRKWADMLQRCNNKNSNNYKYYGGKGIKVCDDWHNFDNFNEWAISNAYEEGLTIDRINPKGNYEPSNCRWATREQQDNNKTNSIFVEINGEVLTLMQVSKKYNVGYPMLQHRYRVGDRGEKLIEQKKRGIKRHGEKQYRQFQKINVNIASEIKWLVRNTKLNQSDIGKIFDVSQGLVSRIKLNKMHVDVKEKRPEWWKTNEKE